jgi:DNA-binding transcriptional ArsR family regulator
MNPEDESELARIFEAVAHPARIRLLQALNERSRRFNEFKVILGIKSSGNITHHLNKLDQLLALQPDGEYIITLQGKRALFLIDLISLEKRNRLVLSYLILSASLFYAIWLTFAYYFSAFNPYTPIIGLLFALIFFIILRLVVKKQIKHEDWQFLWSSKHKI